MSRCACTEYMECHDCSLGDAVPDCPCGSGKPHVCMETIFGCERCTLPHASWKMRAETAERLFLELEAASKSQIRALMETTRKGFQDGFDAASKEARARGRMEGRIEGRKEAAEEAARPLVECADARIGKLEEEVRRLGRLHDGNLGEWNKEREEALERLAAAEKSAYARGVEDAAARIEKTVCLFDLANHIRALAKKEA